jgi:multicomponent Na+:H+ antiporter subunit B
MIAPLELLVSVLLLLSGVALARVRDLFTVMVILSLFSGLMAIMFALLGAPDVAFTEAVVGTGVSTLFLMALIRKVDPSHVSQRHRPQQLAALGVALLVGGVLIYGVNALPTFGSARTPAFEHVASVYLQRAYDDAHTPNVVTAVLADYRAFDTLIEAAVVLTAALACLLVLYRDDDDQTL